MMGESPLQRLVWRLLALPSPIRPRRSALASPVVVAQHAKDEFTRPTAMLVTPTRRAEFVRATCYDASISARDGSGHLRVRSNSRCGWPTALLVQATHVLVSVTHAWHAEVACARNVETNCTRVALANPLPCSEPPNGL